MSKMAEVMMLAGATALGFSMASDPKMKRKAKKMQRQLKRKLNF